MKYKGIELEEVTEPQIFNPPKPMMVWDSDEKYPCVLNVCAIVNREDFRVITERSAWRHCAEIPKPKNITNRELAKWLAQGNGEMRKDTCISTAYSFLFYDNSLANNPVCAYIEVRKWDDTEWHKPTREYLGLEDK